MIEKVYRYILEHNMLKDGDTVVAGVSGGADSVCLLLVLKELCARMPLKIYVVHVNHGIRSEASRDAGYVEELCANLGIPYYLVKTDVRQRAQKERISEEEAGRNIRYEEFNRVLESLGNAGTGKIAVAHTQNDCAETMLFHLFRGSGLQGLSGIRPVRGRIIRPLLCLEREEIESFLHFRGISYCIDRTNEEDTYTRNRIRHHLIPAAREMVNCNAVRHLNETARLAEEAEEFLLRTARMSMECCVRIIAEKKLEINGDAYVKLDTCIRRYLLKDCLSGLAGSAKDITGQHIKECMGLFTKPVGKTIILPYGLQAVKTYDGIRLGYPDKNCRHSVSDISVSVPGRYCAEGLGTVEFTLIKSCDMQNIPEKTYTKWIDYDKIEQSLELRKRRAGDYLVLDQEGRKQSMKSFMINCKIPASERETMLLLADGSHILWIPGYRISYAGRVTEQTRRILQICMEEQKEKGFM